MLYVRVDPNKVNKVFQDSIGMKAKNDKKRVKKRKYMLGGGNNAIKSNQEEYMRHMLCMYTISSHTNSGYIFK